VQQAGCSNINGRERETTTAERILECAVLLKIIIAMLTRQAG